MGSAIALVRLWGEQNESRYVCLCNVNVVVTAWREPDYDTVLSNSDLNLPDGMPVAWSMRAAGISGQMRISGQDLVEQYARSATHEWPAIFLYGSNQDTVERMARNMAACNPQLRIAGYYSPPFRELTPEEDMACVHLINSSGAGIVFVGLGCPKQERWMAAHKGHIKAVMIGAGAAFDYVAKTKPRAPAWMQSAGLEWLFRLMTEPRRLWRRYLFDNTRFVLSLCRPSRWPVVMESCTGRRSAEKNQ